jgi:hypothetical protein
MGAGFAGFNTTKRTGSNMRAQNIFWRITMTKTQLQLLTTLYMAWNACQEADTYGEYCMMRCIHDPLEALLLTGKLTPEIEAFSALLED